MIKKKIIPLLIALGLITSPVLMGCNAKQDMKNTGEKVEDTTKNAAEEAGDLAKEGVDKAGNAIKDVGEAGADLVSKITDKTMDYSEDEFKAEMDKKGYKLQEVEESSKSPFSVDSDDYTVNGEKISVYEYDRNDSSKLEGDLRTITDNGTMINGARMNWTSAPHIYKRGRMVVVYDGNNSNLLTALQEVLGSPLLG